MLWLFTYDTISVNYGKIEGAKFYRMKNYSKTLHLPKTAFGARPNPELLPRIKSKTTTNLYNNQKKSGSKFILHDGPPYANGDLHLGHALNKILKDMINRYHVLHKDQVVEYTPGWDCHGLPIELKVTEPGNTAPEIRQASKSLALTMIERQKAQFEDYGIMTDWNKIYKTMDHSYEVEQLKIFSKLAENGLLVRQLKPVWYSVDSNTALAEAELEYKNKVTTAIDAKFKVVDSKGSNGLPDYLVIWTSTPWTLKGNKAICVNESFQYVRMTDGNDNIIVEESKVDYFLKKKPEYSFLEPVDSTLLLSMKYTNPLTEETCPVLHGDHVTKDAGSGLVHTAPAHGLEDYHIGLKHGLEIRSVVNEDGELDFVSGKVNTESIVKSLLEIYDNLGLLFHVDKNYKHSYPYDWRLKTPVIQMATSQWFINVDKIKKSTLQALEEVDFVPESGRNRLVSFIKNRSEWCISRQRFWGVPIPVVYYNGEPLIKYMNHMIELISDPEVGTNGWFDPNRPVKFWIPESDRARYDDDKLTKGIDTMDVWFDSGTSWSTLKGQIADVYLEGSDQHRGWFQSSILNKVISEGENGEFKKISPYKKIVTHGFILDKNKDKMSKSLGNVIVPTDLILGTNKGIPKLGTDGLRLWCALSDYSKDVAISNEILLRVRDNLKKYRLTFKFLLGNINSYEHDVPWDKLSNFDKYILNKLKQLEVSTGENYAKYNFQQVVQHVNNNMNNVLSAVYFDISKDTLYTEKLSHQGRINIEYVLTQILKTYINILSPITPFLTQEVWDHTPFPELTGEETPFTVPQEFFRLPEIEETPFEEVLMFRTQANGIFEDLRKRKEFTKTLELVVNINNPSNRLLENADILADILQVSKVSFDEPAANKIGQLDTDMGSLEISLSSHHTCPRCWKHTSIEEDTLCGRCEESLL